MNDRGLRDVYLLWRDHILTSSVNISPNKHL
jgi:hypothetical protein